MKRRHQGAAPGFLGPQEGFQALPGCVVKREHSSAGVCQALEAQVRGLM